MSRASKTRSQVFCAGLFGASLLVLAQAALAADADNQGPVETVVVTGSRFNVDAAPAKSSLTTTQPQTIIHKSYIEDSVAPTADYVNVLAIVPSLTGLSINGPGLSDGNVKNTLRGLPDGNFGLSYDGIPFGDTNGPTHHSESYFPGSTIGSAEVDRGPGNAGTIGASTYGGTIKLYSEPLTQDFYLRQTGTGGSWNTFNFNTNVQSGDFDTFGLTSRVLANYQVSGSSGYLSFQSTHRENELLKTETEIAPNWTLTFFGSRNGLSQIVNDNNGASPAQIIAFGKPFALQNTDPRLPTFKSYNPEHKGTDMEYLRLRGDVTDVFHLEDQFYTYAYVNKTVTTANITQTQANILAAAGLGPGAIAQGLGTKVGGVSFANDIQGYTKLNAYRVWGNVLRTAWDYAFGPVTGQLRVGVWSEWAATQRERFYLDITKCAAAGGGFCDGFGVELSGAFADQKTTSGTVFHGISGVGYFEHTGWSQYEPFAELDIRPIENLVITPGIKYVWWEHTIDPNSLVKGKPPTIYGATVPPNPSSFTTTRTLPFVTANYRIQESWSAYFQYANGIYVPDITAFEVNTPILTFPKPQTTTNYQLGTVFYSDNFTADADLYYIESDNTIQQVNCNQLTPPGPASDTCNINAGTIIYKGIEGEATYAFDDSQWDGLLDGLSVFANGSLNSAKAHTAPLNPNSPTFQDKQAPFWTAASGLIYKNGPWKLSLIDKIVGQQYADAPGKRVFVNGSEFYRLGAYNNMNFTGYYDFELDGANVEIGGGIYNVLNDRSLVAVTINDKAISGTSVQDIAHRPGSLDQYFFQPERSYQFTIKVHL
ncbi:MAG TPA: TonB-dependent receptor [Rhizomicrobium sp.]|nr:TonB-dependent receptor [Rhizomicrobium sp.]